MCSVAFYAPLWRRTSVKVLRRSVCVWVCVSVQKSKSNIYTRREWENGRKPLTKRLEERLKGEKKTPIRRRRHYRTRKQTKRADAIDLARASTSIFRIHLVHRRENKNDMTFVHIRV